MIEDLWDSPMHLELKEQLKKKKERKMSLFTNPDIILNLSSHTQSIKHWDLH